MKSGDPFGEAVGSIDSTHTDRLMRPHLIRRIKGFDMLEEEVETTTLEQLLNEQGVDPKDITAAFVDTEGYDYVVMDQLFDTSAEPNMIQYEHVHTQPEVTKLNAELHLREYDLSVTYTDVIATRNT